MWLLCVLSLSNVVELTFFIFYTNLKLRMFVPVISYNYLAQWVLLSLGVAKVTYLPLLHSVLTYRFSICIHGMMVESCVKWLLMGWSCVHYINALSLLYSKFHIHNSIVSVVDKSPPCKKSLHTGLHHHSMYTDGKSEGQHTTKKWMIRDFRYRKG
jgi:hypothetical protein